jgi:hypothetical protein
MTEYTTVSIYKQDSAKLDVIAFCLRKEKRDLMHSLLDNLEEILKISIQNEGAKGKTTLAYNLMVHRVGNKITVAFVPALTVISEKCDMNAPEPTPEQIEKKLGFDKP